MGKGNNIIRSEQVSKRIFAGAVSFELSSSPTHWDHMKAVLIKLALDIDNDLFVSSKR